MVSAAGLSRREKIVLVNFSCRETFIYKKVMMYLLLQITKADVVIQTERFCNDAYISNLLENNCSIIASNYICRSFASIIIFAWQKNRTIIAAQNKAWFQNLWVKNAENATTLFYTAIVACFDQLSGLS